VYKRAILHGFFAKRAVTIYLAYTPWLPPNRVAMICMYKRAMFNGSFAKRAVTMYLSLHAVAPSQIGQP